MPRDSSVSKNAELEHNGPHDDSLNEDLLVNMDDLKSIECSSQDSSGTDRSDGEQSIELEPEVDNQSERVSLLAAMFRKTFSEVKKKVKTVPPKDDG
ncbi:unnamed protein product [Brassica oleracea]